MVANGCGKTRVRINACAGGICAYCRQRSCCTVTIIVSTRGRALTHRHAVSIICHRIFTHRHATKAAAHMQHGIPYSARGHTIAAATCRLGIQLHRAARFAFLARLTLWPRLPRFALFARFTLWPRLPRFAFLALLTLRALQARCSINVERGNIVHNIAITHHPCFELLLIVGERRWCHINVPLRHFQRAHAHLIEKAAKRHRRQIQRMICRHPLHCRGHRPCARVLSHRHVAHRRGAL